METSQGYYKNHGPMTVPGPQAAKLSALPPDIGALCEIVRGVLIHRELARWQYDVTLSEEQRDDAHIRPIQEMLARIWALGPRALNRSS